MKKNILFQIWMVFALSFSIVGLVSCEEDDKSQSNSSGNTATPTQNISLNTTALNLMVGESQAIQATVGQSNVAIVWSSSNPSIASVSNGVVTAKAKGSTTITAKSGTHTATCTVTVNSAQTINGSLIFEVTTPLITQPDYYGGLAVGLGYSAYDVQSNAFLAYGTNSRGKVTIRKSDLPAGVYYYKITLKVGTNTNKIKSGSFVIEAGKENSVKIPLPARHLW